MKGRIFTMADLLLSEEKLTQLTTCWFNFCSSLSKSYIVVKLNTLALISIRTNTQVNQ